MSSPSPSTPSRSRSASPVLTPRSKVKALLAAMDSGSDSDSDEDIGVLMKKAVEPLAGVEEEGPLFNANLPDSEEDGLLLNTGSSDSEDEPVRPRGKLAARMMAAHESKTLEEEPLFIPPLLSSEDDSEDEPARPRGKLAARMMAAHEAKVPKEDAYQRVRKSIFGGSGDGGETPQQERPDDDMEDGDEDDEIPLPTSRRKKAPTKPKASSQSPGTPKSGPQSTEPPPAVDADSDSDGLPENLIGNERFLALVARKRAEREAKEAAEALKEAERRKNRKKIDAELGIGGSDDSGEDNVASQRAPTRRRAGKKALEEMHKETQRMARSMQLTHQARTRKKITKQSLFEKFNFQLSGAAEEKEEAELSSAVTSFVSDRPQGSELVESTEKAEDTGMDVDTEPELPTTEQPTDAPIENMDLDPDTTPKAKDKGKSVLRITETPRTDKGKGKAIDKGKGKAVEKSSPASSKKTRFILPPVRIILPPQHLTKTVGADPDSDSDLEIVAPGAEKPSPVAQSQRQKMIQSLLAVRRVSPPRMRKPGQLTAKELQVELVRKGRLQAVQEREEQIQELRAKGIIVLSAEERAKEEKVVEDLLEKARLEALAIKKAEKRKEAREKGVVKKEGGELADDDEDEDWLEEEEGSICDELSGEEEEEEEGEGGDENEEEGGVVAGDFSDEEKEGEDDTEDGINTPVFSLSSMYPREQASPSVTPRLSEIPAAYIDDEADDDSDGGEFAPLKKKSQNKKEQRKKMRVIEDDDEDQMELEEKPKQPETEKAKSNIPTIFQRAEAAPAFMGLGMTQLFAGTIGGSGEMQIQDSQERIDLLRRGPGEALPNSQILDFDGPSQDVSQPEGSKLRLDYSQSQEWLQESLPKVVLNYEQEQGDDMPDPTQDQGFEHGSSQSTPPRFTQTEEDLELSISTQILDSQFGINRKRRGRLARRETEFSDEEKEEEEKEEVERVEESEPEQDAGDIAENVFDLMKKAAKKKAKREPVDMEKLKADTKGLVEEQAEESEDEYAGIGGVSDDEADAGHDSEMEDMMDDTNNETVDENAMAAFYAEREKAQDEKDVNKLLKDLQSGLLRKKRGAEFDLDDSDEDDDGEARRRAKRRQMAKMRKELLKDGKIAKIASNPKHAAFLSAIEDMDRDEEMDFLDRGEEDLFLELGMVSQSQEVSQSQDRGEGNGSEDASTASVSREDSESGSKNGSREITPLPVPPSRRPVRSKVSTLAHVREQLSFLVEEKETPLDVSDDDEDGEAAAVQPQRRTIAVIDRVAISRSTTAISESTKMAFQISGSSAGFKVPPLLRRATTSSTISTDSESQRSNASKGTERSLGQAENAAGVRRGGKASSSINFHAREQVRSRVQNDREAKKKLERKKEGQKRQSVLGVLAKGSFS